MAVGFWFCSTLECLLFAPIHGKWKDSLVCGLWQLGDYCLICDFKATAWRQKWTVCFSSAKIEPCSRNPQAYIIAKILLSRDIHFKALQQEECLCVDGLITRIIAWENNTQTQVFAAKMCIQCLISKWIMPRVATFDILCKVFGLFLCTVRLYFTFLLHWLLFIH